jgi:tetratricopeptide (TPR) repeat protein
MRAIPGFAVFLLLLCITVARGAVPDGANEYLDGLAALQQAKFSDATTLFAKAVDADEENPDYRIAHGVALIFCEKPTDAQRDLNRAIKLRPGDATARMWLATAVSMLGDFYHDSEIYPVATHDVYVTAVRKMGRDYGAVPWAQKRAQQEANSGFANNMDGPGPREQQLQAGAIASFPKLAAEFAQSAESALTQNNPDIAQLLRDRGIQKVQSKDYSGGINDLNQQLASNPKDPALLAAHAAAALALGAPAVARTECTRALCLDPNNADAYITRATAAAQMGDQRRAQADLASAAALRPATAEQDKATVSAAASQPPAAFNTSEIPQRVEELHSMAVSNAAWDALVGQATSIIKAQNNVRRYFDEDYQDGLRQCMWALAKDPQNADRLAELGDDLYRGAIGIRGEVVEPRGQFHSYRYVGPDQQADEAQRALGYLDSALQIDPRHIPAMTAKAGVLIFQGQWDDAQRLLEQALSIKGDDPKLIRMLSNVLDHIAAVKADQAASERSVKTWEDAFYIYTRFPSPEEKAEADQLDAEAQHLWEISSQALQRAADALKGTADGAYFASVIARRGGNADEALADLQQAEKLAPDNPEYHDLLADVYSERGMRDPSAEERNQAVNLVQTTAGPLLHVAWLQIPMTQYKTARKFITRAMAIDPADPRCAAYMGAIDQQDDKPDDALAWLRAAAALDEAQARFEGRSMINTAMGAVPPDRVGLGINIDLKVGKMLLDNQRYDDALAILRLAASAGNRVPKDRWYEQVPESMLPGDNPDPTTVVPVAYSTADLMAYTHLYAGDILLATGKEANARGQYQFVIHCQSDAPPVVDVGSRIRLPVALAAMALAKDYLKHHEPRAACDVLNGRGISFSQDQKDLWQQYNDLFQQARTEMQGGGGGQSNYPPQYQRPGPLGN